MTKQVLFKLTAVALLAAGCASKEAPVADLLPNVVTVGATYASAPTKSTIDDDGIFAWSSDDKISVYTDAGTWQALPLTEGAETASATFSGTFVGDATAISKVAVAPYTLSPSLDGNTLTLTLPEEIAWAEGQSDNLMVAKDFADGASSVSFKNIGGVVKLTLNNVPAGATKMVFTTPGQNISGAFSLDITDSEPQIATADGASDHVTFTFDELAAAQNMVFYVPVPIGTYNALGFAVKNASDEVLWTFSSTSKNTVDRADLLKMPTLTYVSVGGSGEGGASLSSVIPSNYNGDWYLPKTASDVAVKMNPTDNTINIKYAEDATDSEKPANVYLEVNGGTIGTLNINLPLSHVELNGVGTISSVDSRTNASTLVVEETVIIGSVNVFLGNVEIAGSVTTVNVDESATADGDSAPVQITISNTTTTTTIVANANVNVTAEEGATANVTRSSGVSVAGSGEGDVVIVSGDVTTAAELLEKLKNGDTRITLGADITFSDHSTAESIKHDLVIDLNGHTLTSEVSANYLFAVYNGGSLRFEGEGNLKLQNSYIWAYTGPVTVGGDVNVSGTYTNYAIRSSGPAITVEDNAKVSNTGNYVLYSQKGADIILNGNVQIEGGSAASIRTEAATAGTGNITVKGGAKITTESIAIVLQHTSGTVSIDNATINAVKSAVQASAGNVTIGEATINTTPTADNSVCVYVADGNINVTGNANISTTGKNNLYVAKGNINISGAPVITGGGYAKYAINNSEGDVTITGNARIQNCSYGINVFGGNVNISSDVYIKAGTQAVYLGTANDVTEGDFSVNISAGTFVADMSETLDPDGNQYALKYLLNLQDGPRKLGIAKIVVTGGKFYNFNPADNAAEGEHTNFVADGYKSVQRDNETIDGVEYQVWEVVAE